MKTLLLIDILVCLAQAQMPPRVQDHLLSMDLGFTPVDYNGNHPFERRRKLENEDYTTIEMEYLDSDSYESLRIKFITDLIKGSETYNPLFEDTLQSICDAVADTWSRHLFVYPVNGAIPISPDDCSGFLGDSFPTSLYESGVDDADMVIYVGAYEWFEEADGSIVTLCDEGTLAFAFTCSVDQFDRPVTGAVNFCLSNIIGRKLKEEEQQSTFVPQQVGDGGLPIVTILDGNNQKADVTRVALHEVAHALGFSFNLFKYFRDPETGEPLTPRPFVVTDVDCVDGTTRNLEWPANNTIQTRLNWNGTIYHEVVTPRVMQVARNQFDCQNLTGARLANRPEMYKCTGSHWDERLFLSELMGPLFSGYTDAVSPLTLALFEDSGWYKVSYEGAELSPFGKGRGCDFVNEMCIINDGVPDFGKDIFCNVPSIFLPEGGINSSEIVCEPTHKAFAACDLFDINEIPDKIVTQFIPADGVRYFSDTNLVSLTESVDFCPLPLISARLDCTNTIDHPDHQIYQGESRGLKSRCINGEFNNNVIPGCFEIECDATQHKVVIAGQTCNYDGQLLNVSTLDSRQGTLLNVSTLNSRQGTLVCPYLATICPELFCPGECSGRGVCDYEAVLPRCNCFDAMDTTAACSKDTPKPPSTDPPTSGSDPTTQLPTPESTSDGSMIEAIVALHRGLIAAFLIL